MERRTLIIFILLFSIFSLARPLKTKVVSSFYYSLPLEASSDWIYSIPDCSLLRKTESAAVKKCSTFGNHQFCETIKTVDLSNSLTKEIKKFNIVYHVFQSKEKCKKDRESALSDDQ